MVESPSLFDLVLKHLDLVASQAQQSVACNATHAGRSRLARWLLMTQDRVGGPNLPLTQEYLGIMLGVQRTTVTALSLAMKAAKIIGYRRGVITILDRPALQREACECYGAGQRRARQALGL
jgi:CRP-like cAMP-binding protein